MGLVTPEYIECKNCQLYKEGTCNNCKILSGCYEGIPVKESKQ